MALAVGLGAAVMCSFGLAPATLQVLPASRVLVEGKPMAVMSDSAPGVNIATFGMCTTPSNPTVAAATAAALGVLTPMPCLPVNTPWVPPKPTVMVGGTPTIDMTAKCTCAYGGIIEILQPGATKTMLG